MFVCFEQKREEGSGYPMQMVRDRQKEKGPGTGHPVIHFFQVASPIWGEVAGEPISDPGGLK